MDRVPDFIYCTDTHGDKIDPAARDAALEFCDLYKPRIRIDGGDFMDLASLRSGASEDEKSEAIQGDIKAAERWVIDYKPTQLLWGNHDDRLTKAVTKTRAGSLRNLYIELNERMLLTLREVGCQVFPYDIDDGVFMLGNTKVVHGYHHGKHAVYQAGERYGNVLMGHIHRSERHQIEHYDRPTAESGGCMCSLRLDYNRRRTGTFRWEQSFKYGWVQSDGSIVTQDIKPVDGKWQIPKGLA